MRQKENKEWKLWWCRTSVCACDASFPAVNRSVETNLVWQQSHPPTPTCFQEMPFRLFFFFLLSLFFSRRVFWPCKAPNLMSFPWMWPPSSSACMSLCMVLARGPSYFWHPWSVGHAKQSLGLLTTTVSRISHILLLYFFIPTSFLSSLTRRLSHSSPFLFIYLSTKSLLDLRCAVCIRKKWQWSIVRN